MMKQTFDNVLTYQDRQKQNLKQSNPFFEEILKGNFDNVSEEKREIVDRVKKFFAVIDSIDFSRFDSSALFVDLEMNLKRCRDFSCCQQKFFDDLIKYVQIIKDKQGQSDSELVFYAGGIETELVVNPKFYFEVECLVYEVRLLRDYLWEVCQYRDSSKPFWVVPNLTYGFIPISVIKPYLQRDLPEIEFIEGIKVPSTGARECFFDIKLWKEYQRRLWKEQPTIVVVDGTNGARYHKWVYRNFGCYPRSVYGFWNYFLAWNGFLSKIKKEKYYFNFNLFDLSRRDIQEMIDAFAEYFFAQHEKGSGDIEKDLMKDIREKNFYHLGLYNIAERPVVDRFGRRLPLFQPSSINKRPTMIFVNVGLNDDDIPNYIKKDFPSQKYVHVPAYFDFSNQAHLVGEVLMLNENGRLEKVNLLKMAINYVWARREQEIDIKRSPLFQDYNRNWT